MVQWWITEAWTSTMFKRAHPDSHRNHSITTDPETEQNHAAVEQWHKAENSLKARNGFNRNTQANNLFFMAFIYYGRELLVNHYRKMMSHVLCFTVIFSNTLLSLISSFRVTVDLHLCGDINTQTVKSVYRKTFFDPFPPVMDILNVGTL